MYKTRTLLLAAAIVLSMLSSARAQNADDIIKKHLDAIGGQSAWSKVTSMKLDAAINASGNEIKIGITQVIDKGFRSDISMMGMTGYQIVTPTGGWSFMPFSGQKQAEAMTADDVKESQDELDYMDPFIRYKDLGTKVEYLGKEDVEGTECFKLKVTPKSGKVRTAFIDPESYYLIRQVDKGKANGQEMENTMDFSNFQKLPEGVIVPMVLGGPMGTVSIKKVEINPVVPDSTFKI